MRGGAYGECKGVCGGEAYGECKGVCVCGG